MAFDDVAYRAAMGASSDKMADHMAGGGRRWRVARFANGDSMVGPGWRSYASLREEYRARVGRIAELEGK